MIFSSLRLFSLSSGHILKKGNRPPHGMDIIRLPKSSSPMQEIKQLTGHIWRIYALGFISLLYQLHPGPGADEKSPRSCK
jgi:hypothetical protein